MSIIIRLQNLPWDASALSIRQFFYGLSIPDGGVHIIGGEKGDAFIAFSTDEDARQAMKSDGGLIGNTSIKLFLSSKAEMQNVIAAAREAAAQANAAAQPQTLPSFPPPARFPSSQNQSNSTYSQYAPRELQNSFRSRNFEIPGIRPELKVESSSKFDYSSKSQRGPPFIDRYDGNKFLTPQQFESKKPYFDQNQSNGSYKPLVPQRFPVPWNDPNPMRPFLDKPIEPMRPPLPQREFNNNWNKPYDDYRRGSNEFSRNIAEGRILDEENKISRRQDDSYNSFNPNMPPMRMPEYRNNNFQDWNYNQSRPIYNNVPNNNISNIGDIYSNNPPANMFGGFKEQNIDNSPLRYCIHIKNLPLSFGPKDIRNLFKDFEISSPSLKIVYDRSGKRTGRAYLRLSSIIHVESALRENGRNIFGVPIQIIRCSDREFEQAIQEDGGGQGDRKRARSRSRSPLKKLNNSEGYFAVIKNLPFQSVFKCLKDVNLAKNGGPYAEVKASGKESGHALVQLEDKKDLNVLMSRFKKIFDGHTAFIFEISKTEFTERIEGGRVLKPEKVQLNRDCICLKIDGLSSLANEEKLKNFFSGCSIVPGGVHILLENSGKVFGIAFIEFETHFDVLKALEKNRQYLDNKYLLLEELTLKEMMSQLTRHKSRGRTEMGSSIPKEEIIIYMKNLSFRTQLEDILEFFEGFQVLPDSVQLQYKNDIPTGDGMIKMISRADARVAISKLDRREMLGRSVRLSF